MSEVDAKLADAVHQQAGAIAALTAVNEALMREKIALTAQKASAEARADRLAAFIEALGLSADRVDEGLWISKAGALIDISLDEAGIESRLGPLAPDTKASILMAARGLLKEKRR